MVLNLTVEFLSLDVIRRLTSTFKMLIKKSINLFMLFNFTIVLTKTSFQFTTRLGLSNILHITVLSLSS